MKRLSCLINVVLSIVILNFAVTVYAEDIPEFDGGYVKNINDKYIEMKAKPAETNIFRAFWFVRDKKGMIDVPVKEFKGILIRGQYEFKFFTLHPLLQKLSSDKITYFTPGEEIEIRSKTIGDDAYYFQPKNELTDGEYVGWIGETFWLFKIKEQE